MIVAMDLTKETHYEATPTQVFTMLCDEAFRTKVCEATYALSYEVTVTPGAAGVDGDVTVRVRRVFPAKVPPAAKKLIGDTLDVVQTERWDAPAADGSRHAELLIEVEGKPARMTGSMQLQAVDGGSRHVVEGKLKASVPMIGRRIEEAAARPISRGLEIEGELGTAWLAGVR